eukprot:TRINITY_DN22435_c0_g1_i1.p1 TRINITY_DN22435_c0_g1~~TRINITY_DN22435_c0_g1_i1.p1  ORF type:complete len:120 (+),score=26.40 TRINITY_DN22435_c0_g1_i1:57-362(+)
MAHLARYAVIFKAVVNEVDAEYEATAAKLREDALTRFGCLEFTSVTSEGKEIAISYWPSLEAIKRWRENPQHVDARAKGKAKWYKRYKVEVVEINRQYASL